MVHVGSRRTGQQLQAVLSTLHHEMRESMANEELGPYDPNTADPAAISRWISDRQRLLRNEVVMVQSIRILAQTGY